MLYNVGDIVWLKSGGPRLCVVRHDDVYVTVTWIAVSGEVMINKFLQDCLTTTDPNPKVA